jgi:hypothetical protein
VYSMRGRPSIRICPINGSAPRTSRPSAPEAWLAENSGREGLETVTRFPALHSPNGGYLDTPVAYRPKSRSRGTTSIWCQVESHIWIRASELIAFIVFSLVR